MNKQELTAIITGLINKKKEGVYWDFKESYSNNVVDFVSDIICLANANHFGDRFLIYGVNDKCEIVGIEGDNKKKQNDIIDTLRGSNFAGGIFPDISLETIKINDKNLDILIIADRDQKPYFLVKRKVDGKKILNAGAIYSRVQDSKTEMDATATLYDTERMWRERLGLSQSPLERLKIYLKKPDDWQQRNGTKFYKYFPEFTIKEGEESKEVSHKDSLEWERGEIGYHLGVGHSYRISFYYHTTMLEEESIRSFDHGKKRIVEPDSKPFNNGRIYYYLKNNLNYIYQFYHKCDAVENHAQDLKIPSQEYKNFSMPVFEDERELELYLSYCKNKIGSNDNIMPSSNHEMQNSLFCQLLEIYLEFKKGQ